MEDKQTHTVPFVYENEEYTLSHGSVVIAAITSCTNTSNPSVMLGAGESYAKPRNINSLRVNSFLSM